MNKTVTQQVAALLTELHLSSEQEQLLLKVINTVYCQGKVDQAGTMLGDLADAFAKYDEREEKTQ